MDARRYTDTRLPLLAAISVLASSAGWGYEDGAPPGHTGGFGEPDCSVCHSGNEDEAPAGRLEINGLPATYEPGQQYDLAIVLQHPELESGGFQLAVRTPDGEPAGELKTVSPRTHIVSEGGQPYLEHSRDGRKTDTEGRISWKFRWRAPETHEPVILNIAANAANGDISDLGDYILTLEKKLEPRKER